MTDKDLKRLCYHLNQLSAEELRRLENANLIPSLRLRWETEHQAVIGDIRSALEASDSRKQRLQHLASLYCWLIPQNRLRSWFLYRLESIAVVTQDFTIHKRMAGLMSTRSSDTAAVYMSSESGRYASIVTTDPESGTQEHSVLCLYIWDKLPYLAVCISGLLNLTHFKYFLTATLLRDHEELLVGFYADFDSAFVAACNDVLFERQVHRPHHA